MIAAVVTAALALTVQHSSPIAEHTWGAPACGTPTVEWVDLGPVPYGRTFDGSCVILLNTQRAAAFRYKPLLCTTIVHEWGHLTGHKHSADPRNVMYPTPGRVYWRCWHDRFIAR